MDDTGTTGIGRCVDLGVVLATGSRIPVDRATVADVAVYPPSVVSGYRGS